MPKLNDEQQARFNSLFYDNKPDTGYVLRIMGDEPIKPIQDRDSFYVVATIDPDVTGWFLSQGMRGLKCFFDAESRAMIIESQNNLHIYEVNVIRQTSSGQALVVSIEEYDG